MTTPLNALKNFQLTVALTVGLIGITTAIAPFFKRDPRGKVVKAAEKELGKNDSSVYWKDVLGSAVGAPKEWCGAFALWALHQAGLAKEWPWQIGTGFLYRLPQTSNPKPGDIAYFNNFQHQAVVKSVNTDGTVTLINGNGYDGRVTESRNPKSSVTAFYSIQPLLTA